MLENHSLGLRQRLMSANPSLAVGILLSTVEQSFVIGSGWWAGRNSSLVGAGLSLRAQRSHSKCLKTTFMKTRRIWQDDDNAFNIKIHDLKPNNILHFLLVLAFPTAIILMFNVLMLMWNLLIPLINLENYHLHSFFLKFIFWIFSEEWWSKPSSPLCRYLQTFCWRQEWSERFRAVIQCKELGLRTYFLTFKM